MEQRLTEHVGGLDERGVQVRPVETALGVVDGQPVGPAHVGHQREAPRAVHRRAVDLGLAPPLRPVHEPGDNGETRVKAAGKEINYNATNSWN